MHSYMAHYHDSSHSLLVSHQQKALKTHNNVTHLGRRDFVCQEPGCGRAFGYKHLLQRHFGKVHATAPTSSRDSDSEAHNNDEVETTEQSGDETQDEEQPDTFAIDFTTGNSYAQKSREKMKSNNALRCPHPHLPVLLTGSVSSPVAPNTYPVLSSAECQYVFSRAYDLRRHLRAEHGVEVKREDADRWVKKTKAQKSSSI